MIPGGIRAGRKKITVLHSTAGMDGLHFGNGFGPVSDSFSQDCHTVQTLGISGLTMGQYM